MAALRLELAASGLDAWECGSFAAVERQNHQMTEGREEGLQGQTSEAAATALVDAPTQAEQYEVIAGHFDRQFYLATNADVAVDGLDPIEHYLQHGWREGRRPAPDFDPAFYLATYADVAAAAIEPFYHYVTRGGGEGRQGQAPVANDHAAFDAEQYRVIADHFDRQFYLAAHADVAAAKMDPVEHYLRQGWREGRRPTLDFDPTFYVATYADVADAAVEPFYHYVTRGRQEGRHTQASSATAVEGAGEQVRPEHYEVVVDHFDRQFYLETYTDVAAAGIDPVAHYLRQGWLEGNCPTCDFDTAYYLAQNADVAASGINPFFHYVVAGAQEGRPGSSREATRRAIAPYFQTEYYLQRYDDIADGALDPLAHYVQTGWREGRAPTPEFDTDYYVRANPDVIAAGMNPFEHYVLTGRREGRSTKAPFSAVRAVVTEAHEANIARFLATVHDEQTPDCLPPGDIKRALAVEGERVVVSFSHDEYTRNVGGIQIRVSDEQAAINEAGVSYIHFAPTRPVLHVKDQADFRTVALMLTIDGRSVGVARASDVLDGFDDLVSERGPAITLVLHSLLGHSIPFIRALAERIRPAQSIVWVHDFSTLCTNYSLLRNNLAFCELPPVDSPMCQICAFGNTRKADVALMGTLFEALDPVVMAPSQVAADFWRRNARYRFREAVVAPHAEAVVTGVRPPTQTGQQTFRVAHVGAPAVHKGWLEFLDLAAEFSGDSRYSFYLFSVAPPAHRPNVQHVPVGVTRDDRDAMTKALIEHEIDIVVHWTLCYETYSFTAWESILAGSFVVVRNQSGNAAALIREKNAGVFLDDAVELKRLFASDSLAEAVRAYRAAGVATGHLSPADMAGQILGGSGQ